MISPGCLLLDSDYLMIVCMAQQYGIKPEHQLQLHGGTKDSDKNDKFFAYPTTVSGIFVDLRK